MLNDEMKTAAAIALELSKASPSGRIAWKKFRELMEAEGYEVTTDKAYQEQVRYYMKKTPGSPLESIKKEVGEIYSETRQKQKAQQQLNKMKRSIVDDLSVITELKEVLGTITLTDLQSPTEAKLEATGQYTAVITPSDWHVGLVVDKMNHETQRKRVTEYLKATIQYLKLFDVTKVYVVDLGDIIENSYLHIPTSTATTEFNTATQFSKYIKLFLEFLNGLSQHFDVTYKGSISGNHDRLSKKDETLQGDSFAVMASEVIGHTITLLDNKNLHSDLFDYHKDRVNFYLMGHHLVFVHGDKEKGKGESIIQKYMSILNDPVDYLVKGHTHSFKVETESHGRKIFTSGTLNDANDYARGLGYYSTGSQMLLLVNRHVVTAVDIELGGIT
ncbi:putative DNA polymerase [Lactococcus phage Q54]|uniref:Putative DNA polymerase n=1 Tax=Lactococcus phage Q54 TaxID=382685 RepID=Q0GXV5_9CAUD|nr:exonuclease [Lactococcus phage Q54]ABF22571.1 putative DNA polymerase [Lactococcus phage Q54]